MEGSDCSAREEQVEPGATTTNRKPYRRPELTKHERLAEITLGVQCSSSIPSCISPQDPMY